MAANCNLTSTGGPTTDSTAGHTPGGTNGLKLDGTVPQFSGVTAAALNFASTFTLTGFVYPNVDLPPGSIEIIQKDSAGTDGYNIVWSPNLNGDRQIACSVNATNQAFSASQALAFQKLSNVACVYNAGAATLTASVNAHDGTPLGTVPAITAPAGPWRIGDTTPATAMSATYSEWTAWDIILSNNFRARLMACGVLGLRCLCDGTTPSNYKACTTVGDCGGAPQCTGGECRGWDGGVCAGGANQNRSCTVTNQATDCPTSTCTLPGALTNPPASGATCNVAVP